MKKINGKKTYGQTSINQIKSLTFEEYNDLYLMLKYGTWQEAAKILNVKFSANVNKYLEIIKKYDSLLYNAHENHKKASTMMLMQKQSKEELNKIKKSYDNVQKINITEKVRRK